MRKRSLILQLQGFSYFRFVVLFIQNVHDEEITLKKSNTTVNVRFSLFGEKNGCTHAMLQKKIRS